MTTCTTTDYLAVCVLFYEKVDQTINCLKSFLPSNLPIYILNNGSSLDARQALGKFCEVYSQVTIIDSDENLGVARGRNFLFSHTKEDWLLSVDSDITIDTYNWLEIFKQHRSQHSRAEIFIPRLHLWPENKMSHHEDISIQGNRVIDVVADGETTQSFPGGYSFIHRNLFDRIGGYDEEMFIGYEDYELAIRAIRSGHPIRARFIDEMDLTHRHVGPDTKPDREAILVRYDPERIQRSFDRIVEKHQVYLDGDCQKWANRQVKKFLNQDHPNFKKNRVKYFLYLVEEFFGSCRSIIKRIVLRS